MDGRVSTDSNGGLHLVVAGIVLQQLQQHVRPQAVCPLQVGRRGPCALQHDAMPFKQPGLPPLLLNDQSAPTVADHCRQLYEAPLQAWMQCQAA